MNRGPVKKSLHTRLLLAASAALLAFLGLAGVSLDKAFQYRTEVAVEDRLQGQVLSLLVASDLDPKGRLIMAEEPPDPRFAIIDSGLYGVIVGIDGQEVWRSRSMLDQHLPDSDFLSPGKTLFERTLMNSGEPMFMYHHGVAWEGPGGTTSPFMFTVVEDTRRYKKEIGAFRRTLWTWLGGAALILLIIQVFMLHWSLKPLARVAAEIGSVEKGERDYLENNHPREISRLTESVNRLLRSERERLQRNRHDLDDLAHSLKTPLAVLNSWLDSYPPGGDREEAERQIDRIRQSVDYHLRRSASGAATFSQAVAVAPVVSQIVSALRKVYSAGNPEVSAELQKGLLFYGDRGDLMEVLGNVLDNAFKHCTSRVDIRITSVGESHRPGLSIEISDDGKGFPDSLGTRVLQRGVRADSREGGHGIGLAATCDIVYVYGGTLEISNQAPHGACVTITLPAG